MGANTTPNRPGAGLGRSLEEAIQQIETDLRHAIACVNDTVIPQLRRESISAMRTAADTLRSLADRFEQQSHGAQGAPSEDHPPNTPGEPRP